MWEKGGTFLMIEHLLADWGRKHISLNRASNWHTDRTYTCWLEGDETFCDITPTGYFGKKETQCVSACRNKFDIIH